MKKIVIFISIIVLITCFISRKTNVLIPSNAIRIRIIANSNDLKDQENKAIIKNKVNKILYSKLKHVDNYNDAKDIIQNSIGEIRGIINEYTNDYEITYGDNYFPNKEYKGVEYEAGNYESLLIKLGEGKGNNFWCILFPPLCMIDESKLKDASYTFLVSELINRIK